MRDEGLDKAGSVFAHVIDRVGSEDGVLASGGDQGILVGDFRIDFAVVVNLNANLSKFLNRGVSLRSGHMASVHNGGESIHIVNGNGRSFRIITGIIEGVGLRDTAVAVDHLNGGHVRSATFSGKLELSGRCTILRRITSAFNEELKVNTGAINRLRTTIRNRVGAV